jgi:hypothetical protein
MNVNQMIAELKAEREALTAAMSVLESIAHSRGGRRRGRPPAWLTGAMPAKKDEPSEGPKRVFSLATKRKMALAQKKRWAAKKAAGES